MSSIDIFQIDAFTDKVFHGNPAAVCLLKEWLNDELMQAIALENNLSETAFIMEDAAGFHIRWFTPNGEIDLCGHATLAAGFLLFELAKRPQDTVSFSSLSGPLMVTKKASLLTMDFPKLAYEPVPEPDYLSHLLDKPIAEQYVSDLDYIAVLANEEMVANAQADLKALARLPKRGLIVTARSLQADFYSRCFYPKHNINEDPVTGSAHCVLAPFWAERLGKQALRGTQGSVRRGEVLCEVLPNRVKISGHCKWYSKGRLMF